MTWEGVGTARRTMTSIGELVAVIDRLPAAERERAIEEVDRILEMRPESRRVALGMLALDLVAIDPALDIDLREGGEEAEAC